MSYQPFQTTPRPPIQASSKFLRSFRISWRVRARRGSASQRGLSHVPHQSFASAARRHITNTHTHHYLPPRWQPPQYASIIMRAEMAATTMRNNHARANNNNNNNKGKESVKWNKRSSKLRKGVEKSNLHDKNTQVLYLCIYRREYYVESLESVRKMCANWTYREENASCTQCQRGKLLRSCI